MTKGESPANTLDISGQTFGLLTAVKRLDRQAANKAFYWLFKCRCGNEVELVGTKAKNGDRKDCGCLRRLGNAQRRAALVEAGLTTSERMQL